jgi:hypothetical protein
LLSACGGISLDGGVDARVNNTNGADIHALCADGTPMKPNA